MNVAKIIPKSIMKVKEPSLFTSSHSIAPRASDEAVNLNLYSIFDHLTLNVEPSKILLVVNSSQAVRFSEPCSLLTKSEQSYAT